MILDTITVQPAKPKGIPAGEHSARFVGLDTHVNKKGRTSWKWMFTLDDGHDVWAFSAPEIRVGEPAEQFAEWLIGHPLQAGEAFNPADYINTRYVIRMAKKKDESGYTELVRFDRE